MKFYFQWNTNPFIFPSFPFLSFLCHSIPPHPMPFHSFPFYSNSNVTEYILSLCGCILNLLKWEPVFWQGILNNNRKFPRYKGLNVLWLAQMVKEESFPAHLPISRQRGLFPADPLRWPFMWPVSVQTQELAKAGLGKHWNLKSEKWFEIPTLSLTSSRASHLTFPFSDFSWISKAQIHSQIN